MRVEASRSVFFFARPRFARATRQDRTPGWEDMVEWTNGRIRALPPNERSLFYLLAQHLQIYPLDNLLARIRGCSELDVSGRLRFPERLAALLALEAARESEGLASVARTLPGDPNAPMSLKQFKVLEKLHREATNRFNDAIQTFQRESKPKPKGHGERLETARQARLDFSP